MEKRIVINGFDAKVGVEEKYLYLSPVDGTREGARVEVEGNFTSAVIAKAVASVDYEVKRVMAVHYRYVSYSLRYVMRERSGAYTRRSFFSPDASGKWVKTSSKLENGIY